MGAEQRLTDADHVVVAFDGPVAALPEAGDVAARLRVLMAGDRMPRRVARATDPFVVLEHAGQIGPATARAVSAQLRRIEGELLVGAAIAPGVVAAVATMAEAGTHVTVVSTLDAAAVRSFLVMHGLQTHVRHFAGRAGPGRETTSDLLATVVRDRAIASGVFVAGTAGDAAAGRRAGLDTYRYRPAEGTSWFESLERVRRQRRRRTTSSVS